MLRQIRRLGLPAVLPMLALAVPNGDFVFVEAPFASCHASTLVETARGELLAAWFGGSGEGRPDVAIWGARRAGDRWSEPFELAREPNIAAYNPVLFFARDATLWLYYKFGPSPSGWTAARRFSRDRGRTWSPVEHLPAGLYGPIKNKPLVLAGGVIVSGTSVESYQAWSCWIERSTDNGVHWTRHGPIVVPGEPYGIIQPAVTRLPDGRLRMFARSTHRIGRICYADSTDDGITWTSARPTALPNPNSGIDATVLEDGRIVLIYNHTEKGRSPLNAAVSRDGETWNMFLTLESGSGEYSYPAVIQASDHTVHVTYTWNRKRIKHFEIPLESIP